MIKKIILLYTLLFNIVLEVLPESVWTINIHKYKAHRLENKK